MARPGRHRLTTTLVTLLILAALAYGLDWAARLVADNRVAATVRAGTQSSQVSVSIGGALFVPQVVNGRYPHVVVRMSGLTAQGLSVSSLRTDLNDVRLPFADVLHNAIHTILVGSTHEQALITYAALNAYLAAHGQPVTVSPAGAGMVRLSTVVSALGQSLPVAAEATVTAAGSSLDVTPTRVLTSSPVVNAIGDAALKLRLTFRIPMPPLPFGQRIEAVTPTASGLLVTAGGQNVVITPQGVTAR